MITQKAIIDKYLGIPYKHQGRSLDGLDCWQFIRNVYQDLGHKLLDIDADYTEDWSWEGKNYFIENYSKQWVRVLNPELWDVLLFNNGQHIPNHCGLFLEDGKFMHCCKQGVVISRLDQDTWQKRFEGYYGLIIS
jgi:cell wall-associated NlpC family hydrolase